MKTIRVKKRNGKLEDWDVEKIHKVIKWAVDGYEGVSVSDIGMHAELNLYDKITTREIHDVLVQSASDLISEEEPNYQWVASRLLSYKLRKDVWGGKEPPRLIDHIKSLVKQGIYDPEILTKYTKDEINKIGNYINHDRDYNFTYAGLQQLIDKYLLKHRITGEVYETPQFAYMLISLCLFQNYGENRLDYVKRAYDHFSTFKINLPTPIMAGVRTKLRQFASCILVDVGDDLDSIFSSVNAVAKYTSQRAGIGINMGRIRPVNSPIRNGEVIHTGVVPFLKVFESTVKSTSQNALRGGGATCNMPWWHFEIEDIVILKNNAGTDDNRVRKLDYVIQLDKVFYERVINNQDITLFSPHECIGLYESFGHPEFQCLYEQYEKDESIKIKKVIPARKLIDMIAKERLETGRIYIMNVDNCNQNGSWNVDCKMTNLCCISGHTKLRIITESANREEIIDGEYTILEILDFLNKGITVKTPSKNLDTKKIEYKSILAIIKTQENADVLEITSNRTEEKLRCTPDHQIYTRNRGYVQAEFLKEEDELDILCEYAIASNTTHIKQFDKKIDVYDLEVEDNHNFFANGILIKNCEIVQHTKPIHSLEDEEGEIGVCILSALNLLEIKNDEELRSSCDIVIRLLEELIDYQEYPVKAAENFCKKRRSLGIGVTNFAAWLAKQKLFYDNEQALSVVDELFEKTQYYMLCTSNELAKEKGECERFADTKYAQGLLPFEWANKNGIGLIDRPHSMDWEALREDIKKWGLRHSTLSTIQPCESSSVIQNSTNGIEPIRKIITFKKAKNGTLKQLAPMYPRYKNYYTLAFDIKSNDCINKLAAIMQKWIDMSISLNHYYNYAHYQDGQIPRSVIVRDLITAYKYGIKTLYYANSPDGDNDVAGACSSGSCAI